VRTPTIGGAPAVDRQAVLGEILLEGGLEVDHPRHVVQRLLQLAGVVLEQRDLVAADVDLERLLGGRVRVLLDRDLDAGDAPEA